MIEVKSTYEFPSPVVAVFFFLLILVTSALMALSIQNLNMRAEEKVIVEDYCATVNAHDVNKYKSCRDTDMRAVLINLKEQELRKNGLLEDLPTVELK